MIRLTAYIILALIIALSAYWISSNPGQMLITWQGWEIRFSTAVMIFLAVIYTGLIWALLWLARKLNVSAFFSNPKRLAAKRAKGESDLDQAWSCYALADYKEAIKFGLRAKSKLGENGSVLRLLARSTADMGESKNPYLDRLKDSATSSVWVLKQELDRYLDQKSWAEAKALVHDMLVSHPRNPSLLKLDFLLSARLGDWQEAKKTLQIAAKEKATLGPSEQKHYNAVIDYCLALEEKAAGNKAESLKLAKSALKYDPSFAPAALSAARLYIEQDDKRNAENILTAVWKTAPNAEIADVIAELYPHESSAETFRRLKKIAHSAPDYSESDHLLARAAIDAEQWPDARRALENTLSSDKASKTTYYLLALLERKQKSDKEASDKLIEKSRMAPADNHWLCSSCRKIPTHYLPICQNCGEFDKINWFNI